jgi:nicotinamide mononucleotide (NMN) deamidase PncC
MSEFFQNKKLGSETDQESDSESSDVDINLKSVILEKQVNNDISYLLSVSVAESVTAGALSNTLCSEPGSSSFFLGGIVAYNMETQKNLLSVDAEYAEKTNFANPFTTYTMAKNVTEIFKSRIGLSTTGYSLPLFREPDLINGKCEINVKMPYAYICIYDSYIDSHKIYKITNSDFVASGNQKVQRAQMQSKISLKCKQIFYEYCKDIAPKQL